jgi:glucose-6-phosphate isomerase
MTNLQSPQTIFRYFDYRKQRITSETRRLLIDLAEQSGLRRHIDATFAGDRTNVTEGRAVLHAALRGPKGEHFAVDGKNVVPEDHAALNKMAAFAGQIRSGDWKGHTGRRVNNDVPLSHDSSANALIQHYSKVKQRTK